MNEEIQIYHKQEWGNKTYVNIQQGNRKHKMIAKLEILDSGSTC